MSMVWRWIVAFLVWLSADHERIATEPARAASAVAVARASIIEQMEARPLPPAPPGPTACKCSSTCVRGLWRPDGRIEARCDCTCPRCVAERAKACTTGTCPPR